MPSLIASCAIAVSAMAPFWFVVSIDDRLAGVADGGLGFPRGHGHRESDAPPPVLGGGATAAARAGGARGPAPAVACAAHGGRRGRHRDRRRRAGDDRGRIGRSAGPGGAAGARGPPAVRPRDPGRVERCSDSGEPVAGEAGRDRPPGAPAGAGAAAVRRRGVPPGDLGRRVRQPRRGGRPRAANRAPQRPNAAPLHARTYGWIVPVDPGSVHDWQLARLGGRLDRAQTELEAASDLFTVAAPTDTIAGVRATSRVSGERLLILGGDAAVLLLGFAVLAATRLRRDHRAMRRRLTWAGARRSQILLVEATEVVGITLVASVAGWAVGTGAGALLARHLGAPGAPAVQHSVLTGRALGVAAALAALTALVMLAALRTEAISFGGLSFSVADVAALGALGAVLLALARGQADAASLES